MRWSANLNPNLGLERRAEFRVPFNVERARLLLFSARASLVARTARAGLCRFLCRLSTFTLTRVSRSPTFRSFFFLFLSFPFFRPWMRHATGAPVLRTLDGAGKKALTAVSQLPPLSYIHTWWTALLRARTRFTRASVRCARAWISDTDWKNGRICTYIYRVYEIRIGRIEGEVDSTLVDFTFFLNFPDFTFNATRITVLSMYDNCRERSITLFLLVESSIFSFNFGAPNVRILRFGARAAYNAWRTGQRIDHRA